MPTLDTSMILTSGEIHLWRFDASRPASEDDLSAEERERADRRIGDAYVEFVAAHVALRDLAGSYLDIPAAAVELICEEGAPPRIPGCDLELSLSHRLGAGLVAISLDAVGVDLEERRAFPAEEVSDIAAFILTRPELSALGARPYWEQGHALARVWTRKEAVMKALGCGFGDISIASIETQTTSVDRYVACAPDGRILRGADIEIGAEMIAAVATTGEMSRLVLRSYEAGVR